MTVTSPGNRNSRAIPKGSWPCLAGRLQFLPGLFPFSATFPYSWQSQRKHTMPKQLCNFLTAVEFALEWILCTVLAWDPPLASGVQKAQTHRVASVTLRELDWDKPGPGEATTTLRVCLSWCPVPPGVLFPVPWIPVLLANRQLRPSNNTQILQELESAAASNTKATHSTAIFWEILTFFSLPPPTLHPFKHTQ